MVPKTIVTYACQICDLTYRTEQEAVICETQMPDKRILEVGDIVSCPGRFGWFDGDIAWVVNPDGKKGDLAFYYVVTHIDGDEDNAHRTRYHLFTNAMTGKQGYKSGYTFNVGHITPRKAVNPPANVVKDSKDLIGKKAKHLLA